MRRSCVDLLGESDRAPEPIEIWILELIDRVGNVRVEHNSVVQLIDQSLDWSLLSMQIFF